MHGTIASYSDVARPPFALTHLQQLEAEAIHIMREAVAESDNPVMLYSIGKDSSVLLHLALKAFYPAKPPFPIMHIDTGWKFSEMIAFRDARARTRPRPDRPQESRRHCARHQSSHARFGSAHRRDEDAGPTSGA